MIKRNESIIETMSCKGNHRSVAGLIRKLTDGTCTFKVVLQVHTVGL